MTRRVLVVGIDPAETTGICILSVDADKPALHHAWRWVSGVTISKAHSVKRTKAMNALALYYRCKELLGALDVPVVVIERPADAAAAWKGAQGQRGQSTGTAFAIGESYGMLAAAAFECGAKVYDYPVTSRKANPAKRKPERVGWMPMVAGGKSGQLWHVARREQTLSVLHDISVELRGRPHDGVLASDRAQKLDENILMALGVLRFHLLRQAIL